MLYGRLHCEHFASDGYRSKHDSALKMDDWPTWAMAVQVALHADGLQIFLISLQV
jgi:hypothetical protein